MGGFGRWSADFYDFTVKLGHGGGDEFDWFGDVHDRAIRNGARHGTPVLTSPTGETDPRINLFFRTGAMADGAVSTWRRYAYSLVVWLEFLEMSGRGWDRATAGDVEAFKHWRLTDLRNLDRVQPTSFDTDRAALNALYAWAGPRYGVVNPVATVRSGGRGRRAPRYGEDSGNRRGGRDGLRPAGARRRQVKWLLRPALEQWRDVGLRGYGFDGLRRDGWSGCSEDRDVAFVEGLYGTGLRLREWSSVLDVELPVGAAARMSRAWLAAACVKGGGEGRRYFVPRSVLARVGSYLDPVEGSRAEAVGRARQAGRYDALHGVRIVTGYNARTRALYIEGAGRASAVSVDVVGPDERRRLFRRAPGGLEPLALWLAPDGMPKKAGGWEDTFAAANERIAGAWADSPGGDGAARGDACPLWARPHMMRHSFALKWFSVLSVVWQHQVGGFTDKELKDLREQFGDVWHQMATLLGHADPATTRAHYLEPFTRLQVDYLMSMLDDDERQGIDALIRAVAADSGLVIGSVAAPGACW